MWRMLAALKLIQEPGDLSEKPLLGEKRPKPRLVWENPLLSAGTLKGKPKAKLRVASGQSVYGYVGGNPLRYIDPTGLVAPVVLAGFCAAGAVGPIYSLATGNGSAAGVVAGCAIGTLGAVGAAATASATVARITAGLIGAASAGLGIVGDAQGAPSPSGVPDRNEPLPGMGSLDPVDEHTQRLFCQLNPGAPNCQEDESKECK